MNIKRLISISIIIISQLTAHAQNKIEPDLLKNSDKEKMNHWVDSVFNQMSLDQKIGQTIMAITYGNNTEALRKELLGYVNNQYIGGIIYLKGTVEGQVSLTNLCQEASKIPLMIAIDGEWGLSMRLANTTRFPKNMMLGAIQDDSLVYYYGQEVARQCKVMGIHVNFAPTIDINSNPDNPVIGIRSYGENKERVAKLGIMYAKGLESGKVLAVGKHFPGHGDTSTDSHYTLPLIEHSRERIDSIELYPFREYINAGLGSMMTAHLNIPSLDSVKGPGSLSKPIVTDLLQNELGFSGLIFSDGLAMKGVSDEPNMSVRVIEAGNDILLGPAFPAKEFNNIKAAVENGTISEETINEKCRKILTYKYLLGINNQQPVDPENIDAKLNTSYAEWIARRMNQKAITLVKNENDILPLKNLDVNKVAAISIGAPARNPFHNTLNLYDNVTCFDVADASALPQLKSKLEGFSTIILSIHTNKAYNAAINDIIKNKKAVLAFFTVPYQIASYANAVNSSDALVIGYENTDFAQEYAAQAIYGGYAFEGKLPVSIKNLYKEGEGIETPKSRLAYNLPEEVGIPAYKFNEIANIIEEGISEKAFPGCQILIAKDGVVVYNHSFGTFEYKKKRFVTNDDIYDIASMTKAIATIPAIMKLYDEKKIRLQTPLSSYIRVMAGSDKKNITVRQALFHETGLPSFIAYYLPAIDAKSYLGRLYSNKQDETYNAQLDVNTWGRTDYKFKSSLISFTPAKGYDLQIADNLYIKEAYHDTIVQEIINSKLRASKRYHYSCLNFILLKEAVENISKTDLNTYLQKHFYKKLGATTTTFNPLKKFDKTRIAPTEKDDFLRKQLLQGYVHDEGAAFLGGISGNAGLFSNANDVAKLCQMWLNKGEYGGEQFLSKETCRLFTTTKSARSRRGLGFDKPEPSTGKTSPCSPSTPINTYGHTGFTGTCFWVDPDNNLIYIFLSNRVYDKRTNKKLMELNIRSRIQEEIYNAIRNDSVYNNNNI